MKNIDIKKIKAILIFILSLLTISSPIHSEIYKWIDEKGTIHFADDPSKIPERYRENTETLSAPKIPSSQIDKQVPKPVLPGVSTVESKGFEVDLLRRHELLLAEVIINRRVRQYFIVDTGASFTLINWAVAKELGITVDENTPLIRAVSASDVILTPLVTLNSVRVGEAEVENVEALIHNMPNYQGLLGNSFLNKFKVIIDSLNAKMTLLSLKGDPSPERPGGYSKDYWVGQFRFYYRNLDELKKLKAKYEALGSRSEVNRINNAIRYFENQLSELERRASFAGVPRHWRE
jgi:clan AA aspartic protease (TIGR02281 family)